jgi:CubicO group peptidase (beta-lactamase class C family)
MPRQILRHSFLACALVCCAASAQSPTAVAPAIAQKLNEIIAHVRDDGRPGGIIVRVQSLKDNRVWEGSAGPFDEAKEAPVQPNDPFRVASITKSFTAAVIWRLAEQRKLGIDDLMSRYIEPSIVARIHVLNGASSGERITIRQLLCHCSGIYDYAADNNWNRFVFAHPEKPWEPKELIEVAIRSGEPYFAPGEGHHYSDTGYLLLGMIIEKVTGKPLATAYREYVYTPLGLKETYLEGREPAIGRPRSHNYVGFLDDANYDPTSDAYASGGQVSTTTDLALFITSVLQGHFFKDPKTLAATLAVAEAPERPHDPVKASRKQKTRFMFYSEERGGVEFIGHAGVWGAAMFYQPERQLVITGTSNQEERRLPLGDIARAFDVSTASVR